MTTQEPNSDNIVTMISDKFQHFVGGFRIDLPCVISDNKTLYIKDLYDLIDFLDNGEIYVRTVKFWHAYLKGFTVTLIILDLKSGELLKRTHRLNNDTLPCNWVLVNGEIFESKSEPEEGVKNDCHDRKL